MPKEFRKDQIDPPEEPNQEVTVFEKIIHEVYKLLHDPNVKEKPRQEQVDQKEQPLDPSE